MNRYYEQVAYPHTHKKRKCHAPEQIVKKLRESASQYQIWAFILLSELYNIAWLNVTSTVEGYKRMTGKKTFAYIILGLAGCVLTGCVERKLTINTRPQGAMVELNDEQIGTAPVTTSFNWYGDYCVRLSMTGYETLDTHRLLKAPWYDYFPFDFFAQFLYPGRIVNSYEWTYELAPKQPVSREQLIDRAERLKGQLDSEGSEGR